LISCLLFRSASCSAGGGKGAEPERSGGGGRCLLRVLRGGQPGSLQGHLAPQRELTLSIQQFCQKFFFKIKQNESKGGTG
jgi:hypothetical protein